MRPIAFLLMIVSLLAGCATTLRNPQTGQDATCQAGNAIAVGWGPVGWAMMGLAAAANTAHASDYKDCVKRLKESGYTEIVNSPDPPASGTDFDRRLQR